MFNTLMEELFLIHTGYLGSDDASEEDHYRGILILTPI